MSKGARNRRIKRYAGQKATEIDGLTAKTLARRLRRVLGWNGKYGKLSRIKSPGSLTQDGRSI